MKKICITLLTPLLLLLVAGCEKEFENPNAADGAEVVKSAEGLTALIVGIKKEYSVGGLSALYNAVSANAMTTKEVFVINTGNGELAALEAGKSALGANNAFLRNIWTSANIVRANGQLLIDNYQNVSETGTTEMIRVYGHVFKALGIGTLCQFWEQVTTENITAPEFLNGKRARFKPRAEALQEAVDLLSAAAAITETTAPSAFFNLKVGTDFDIKNTCYALLARYNLMLGKYADALTAANKVDLSKRSFFRFDAISQNPIFRISLVTNNVYNGRANFGLPAILAPDANDARVPFYLGTANPIRVQGFFKNDADQIPLYLPGEITLIKAECLARMDMLPEAIVQLDLIRTKSADPFNVTAKTLAYAGPVEKDAVLFDIYRQRCIELYMSGLKLEDSRRFGRPGPSAIPMVEERNRNFYPYPQVERDNNPNTPNDPPI